MNRIALLAAAAALGLVAPAAAQDFGRYDRSGDVGRVYIGAGYTQFDAEDIDVGGITGRAGYRFHPNFAVEGEATFGIDEDEADIFGTPVDIELDNQWGVYGVGILPIGNAFDLFARAGYVQVEAEGSVGGFTAGVDDDGFGYGAGVTWRATDNFGIRGDYTRLEGDDDGVNAWGVTAQWMF